MKKTMKWLTSVVVFILCFAVLFTTVSEILRRKTVGQMWKRKQNPAEQKDNKKVTEVL